MIRRLIFLGLLLLLACPGCGSSEPDRLETIPVEGTLLVDGKPPGRLLLQLVPTSTASEGLQNPGVNGYVKEDGTFTLTTYEPDDGAPEGTYNVNLTMDPMAAPNVPGVKPATVEIKKPEGGGTLSLEVRLEGTGATMTGLPRPGQEGRASGMPRP